MTWEEDPMRRLIVLVIGLGATIWLAVPAAAATALHVTPGMTSAGGSVQVSGTCEANSSGFAISHAFLHDAAHDFAGVGAAPFTTDAAGNFAVTAQIPASTAPGSYPVTARCGGGNLGISASLTVTHAVSPPTAVPAGSGGLAATTSHRAQIEQLAIAGIGVGLLLIGGLSVARRLIRVRP